MHMKPIAEFQEWFGDSEVVDADGAPLVVYHGTKTQFAAFDEDAIAHFGFHFGTRHQASKFGKKIMAVHLALSNPLRLPDLGTWGFENLARNLDSRGLGIIDGADYERAWGANDQNAELRKILLEKGYDGVVYGNEVEGAGDSFIALRASQICLAELASEQARDTALDAPHEPIILFHGTATKFDVFNPSDSGFYGCGIYLTDDERQAADYADGALGLDTPTVMTVSVSIKNPYIFDAPYAIEEPTNLTLVKALCRGADRKRMLKRMDSMGNFSTEFQDHLLSLGHDGLIIRMPDGETEYIAFQGDQVRHISSIDVADWFAVADHAASPAECEVTP